MKRAIKELFTARYQPDTDTIEGCTHDGLAWHHENRHREQLQSKTIRNLLHITHLILLGLGGAAIFGGPIHGYGHEGLFIAGLAMIPYLILMLGLEIDAWITPIYRTGCPTSKKNTEGNT